MLTQMRRILIPAYRVDEALNLLEGAESESAGDDAS
jgi:hypothetical protein